MMIADRWKIFEPTMLTPHVFIKRSSVVSMAQDVPIRPVRWRIVTDKSTNESRVKYNGPYVDTTTVHGSDTISMAKMKFPPETEPEQFFLLLALTGTLDA